MKEFEHGGNVWQEGDPSEWIDFSANINPEGTPQEIKNQLLKAIDDITYYPDVAMTDTKERMAEFLSVSPSNILPTNGGIAALDCIVASEKPTKTILFQPTFVEYERISRKYGIPTVLVPMINESDEITYDIHSAISHCTEGAMIFLCNPSNPIGTVLKKDRMIELLIRAEEKKAKVVVDEAFMDYCEEHTMRQYVESFDNLIVAGSFTKMFAIPGIRLGYLCSNQKNIQKYGDFLNPWSLSAFAVHTVKALNEVENYQANSVRLNNDRREWLRKQLKSRGFFVFPSSQVRKSV